MNYTIYTKGLDRASLSIAIDLKLEKMLGFVVILILSLCSAISAEVSTVSGTIYCNNNVSFYVNGELVAVDPITGAPHNAFNVTFEVDTDKDVTFAVNAIDIADDTTGLELNDRCLGAGGFRAFFSNGVVTNSSWKCSTYHYGPVNWKSCFAAADRDPALKVLPACLFNVSADDGLNTGCFSRTTPIPDGWAGVDFDESSWEYATEWDDDYVRPFVWPAFPAGCTDPDTIISPQLDPNGDNITCPSNLNWGDSKFIWRPDIDLDNRILCRYTISSSSSGGSPPLLTALSTVGVILSAIITHTVA